MNGILGANIARENQNGIELNDSNTHEIHDNKITSNLDGIYMNWSNWDIECSSNNMSSNQVVDVFVSGNFNHDNILFNNIFVDNSVQAQDYSNVGDNSWNTIEIGNYWSDYEGKDLDGDGIGDVPYNILSAPGIQDMLPILFPIDEDRPPLGDEYPWIAVIVFVVIVLGCLLSSCIKKALIRDQNGFTRHSVQNYKVPGHKFLQKRL